MGAEPGAVACYRLSLADGLATRARLATSEEQVRRYELGMRRNARDLDMVRCVLLQMGLTQVLPHRYVPFGMRVLHLCRRHTGATRDRLLATVVGEWALRLPEAASHEERQARLRAVAERLAALYDEAQAGLSVGQ
jgi:hypothetical protein